jgi:hypothetical protein
VKSFLVFIIALFNFNAFAMESPVSDDCPSCHRSLSGMPMNGSLSDVEKIANARDPKLVELSNTICKRLSRYQAQGHSTPQEILESNILSYLNISKDTPNYRKKITSFWNKNFSNLVCTWADFGMTAPQHLSKRIIDMDLHKQVYYKYLLRDKEIDINGIDIVDGRKETILDYIDGILADPEAGDKYNVKEIKKLKRMFVKHFDAKNARDLDA